MIEIAGPSLGVDEERAVLEVMASGRLVQGPRVEAFEAAFATYAGARHAVATSSGATALGAMLTAHGIGPNDEVILPSFSFFATAAAVLGVGARPVFADIDPVTFCLSADAASAAITPHTRAILLVHLFGLPADVDAFARLCTRHGLLLLEDAAQAHGASVGTRKAGTFGTSAFSFHASKNMTTGEGGMVLTDDAALAERLRMLRNHGRDAQGRHAVAASNSRMSEMAAAIGLVQLRRLDGFNAARRANARYFDEHLVGTGLTTPSEPGGRTHVYQQYTVRVPRGTDRDAFVAALVRRGVGARVYYATPNHLEPALHGDARIRKSELPETLRASREVLSIPVHPGLGTAERSAVVEAVLAAAR